MRRRGNKSSKVPNVKLRPAQPSTSRVRPEEPSTFWVQDTQAGSDDTSATDLCPRPFKGLVVCATGVVDKPTLFKQALELGATSVMAFTDRVTHLVAADHGGAKYQCALERKIPILQPSWITESYKVWLRGDDVDLRESVEKYRLPIFSGVILSPSGINDIKRRTEINNILVRHQGVYMKNLERPVKVTHLLCSGDEETDKMQYAERFNSRGEARIHLVWEEWFWDSLEFGGRFDEEKYQVRRPRPKLRPVSNPPSSPPPSSAVPEFSDVASSDPYPSQNPHTAQNSETNADDAEDEIASVKRLPAVTLQIWESLLKPRGYEVTGGRLVLSPSKAKKSTYPPEKNLEPTSPSDKPKATSVISSFRRANSFAPIPAAKDPAVHRTFGRSSTIALITEVRADNRVDMTENQAGPSTTNGSSLFAGLKFRALGEARSVSVRTAIEGCGGYLVSEIQADEDVDYIIVRLVSGSKFYRDEGDESERIKYRTECWLEHCIFEDRLCPPAAHVSFTPLKITTPVPGAENVSLSFSGLDQSETCWVRRLLRALGINLAPNFSRKSTHLLCPSGTGAKFDKALEWSVPVINMGWLADIAATGSVPPVTSFLVSTAGHGYQTTEVAAGNAHQTHTCVNNGKGKGKQINHDVRANTDDEPAKPNNTQEKVAPTPPSRVDTFGQPNELLGFARTRSDQTVSTSDSLEYINPPNAFGLPVHNNATAGPSRQATLEDMDGDGRIPSSKTPSPMKVPSSRRPSVSPVKIPDKVAKALQESISSLLGKRQPSEDDLAKVNRVGKRARPHSKNKPPSRQPSHDVLRPQPLPPPIPAYNDYGASEFYDELNLYSADRGADESMRVLYEDPGQRAEKNRLMSLFESEEEKPDTSKARGSATDRGRGTVRRSTRIAGF